MRIPEHLSRRDFLRLSSLLAVSLATTACQPTTAEKTISRPTPVPTVPFPSPYLSLSDILAPPTSETKPTSVPVPPELIEFTPLPIPDLTRDTYRVSFSDITAEVPKYLKIDIRGRRRTIPSWWHILYRYCHPYLINFEVIRENQPPEFYIYNEYVPGRFYLANIIAKDSSSRNPQLCEEDKNLSGFSEGQVYIDSLSCDGKILYHVISFGKFAQAIIIADIPGSTKTVIKDGQQRPLTAELSDDGQRLFLTLPAVSPQPLRTTYLFDLAKNWTLISVSDQSH